MSTAIFWFRRDLRLDDNTGLQRALEEYDTVLPVFIFDEQIVKELSSNDPRISFIYKQLFYINDLLKKYGSGLHIFKGNPIDVWKELLGKIEFQAVYINRDYEPYAKERDRSIESLLKNHSIELKHFKDQVIFEGGEILKDDGKPYHMFTPYKNKWLKRYLSNHNFETPDYSKFKKTQTDFPSMSSLGFERSELEVKPYDPSVIADYENERNFPAKEGGSNLGPHLRFGTLSIRRLTAHILTVSDTLLSELIWREFFMQILDHYPKVVFENFKSKYNGIVWRNNKEEFEKWKHGLTGFPMVDAGMRELNSTGYMHNRVRMITAGFLCKHLLIDWRWGEAYFASKLMDYELSSNNGNWQWAAGTGCDAAPYFRIFNPYEQAKKFDKEQQYVRKWIAEIGTSDYPEPMVDHKIARKRALEVYKIGIDS
ncbi:cryptochrome/photolyase family protein [Lutimonas sp.]|uniref:cryptochrome/photolyase family protein n=1 Tax=Lutimonas sp. TaxID=1872403 RepID=UPI003D9BA2A9